MLFHRFPVEYQMDSQDCGPASLKIIAKHFGKYNSLQFMRIGIGIADVIWGEELYNSLKKILL